MSLGGLMITIIVARMILLALRGPRALNRGQQPQQLDTGPTRYGEASLGDTARAFPDADITRFGDKLCNLDLDVVDLELSEEAQAGYSEAPNTYENAKQAVNRARYESDTAAIAHILEGGCYATTCMKSRAQGQSVLERRPLCFFNPAHGPSTRDVIWAPPGGMPREVPTYVLDTARVTSGMGPHIRMVQQGYQAIPYWQGQGHAAYARSYYESYGLDPVVQGLAKGALLSGGFSLLMGLLDD